MASSFKIDLKVETPDKEIISNTQTVKVEAYDTLEVSIPAETSQPVGVEVQPSEKGKVKFLLIKVDTYDGELKYSIGDKASEPWISVKALQVIPDNGLIPLLPENLKTFWFQNTAKEARTVLILVGRNVVASLTDSGEETASGQAETAAQESAQIAS